jgi:hypothetical protein
MQKIVETVRRRWQQRNHKGKVSAFAGYNPATTYRPNDAAPVFVSGVGRSGTHFIAALLRLSHDIRCLHLDDVGHELGDALQIHGKWFGRIPTNDGFVNGRGFLIEESLKDKKRYVEANPLIAFSIADLIRAFGGKAIVIIRHPRKVVESHFRKGWYENISLEFGDITNYDYSAVRPVHSFSRFKPKTFETFERWKDLTRLGKIAWMYRSTYEEMFRRLEEIHRTSWTVLYLDTFDFAAYEKLCDDCGIRDKVNKTTFDRTRDVRPGKGTSVPIKWDSVARTEFDDQIRECIKLFHGLVNSDNWLFDP